MAPWKIVARYYRELGTWEFTLQRITDGVVEWYPKHWEKVDDARAEQERLENL